jgi:uncharacterized Ntn-hydrolase superfamily protein
MTRDPSLLRWTALSAVLALTVTAGFAAEDPSHRAGSVARDPVAATADVEPGGPGESPARQPVATFSIVGADTQTGELGVAVASRFFAVGSVVPWARAGVGAIATQSFANTSYGPRGLDYMAGGSNPEAVLRWLLAKDAQGQRRQVGIVSATGQSVTFTGTECVSWAGGRKGRDYAVQGNILTGEEVVVAMEKTFLETGGSLAQRLYAALAAGEAAGGDSRGKQSAALLVVKEDGGYGGFTDRYIDIRVDDHADPVGELGRLLEIAEVNGMWNLAWTAYTRKRYDEALPLMEQTTATAREAGSGVLPEVLYDLAVVRAHAGQSEEALAALEEGVASNPKLIQAAREDPDLESLRDLEGFAAAFGGKESGEESGGSD